MATFHTRSKTDSLTFGQGSKFPTAMIPTKRDVVKYCYYVRRNEDAKGKGSSSAHQCYRLVATEIENIWHKFSFPTIETEGVFSKVCRLMEKASNLNKTSRLRRNANFYDKLKAFDNMFDICSCNCCDLGVEREKCRCTFKSQ